MVASGDGEQTTCPEECEPQSEGSPGIVLDEETPARFIYLEDYVNDDGFLSPTVIPSQDSSRHGLSFTRLNCVCLQEIDERGRTFEARKPTNMYRGIAIVVARDVRELRTRGKSQEVCVVDDAGPENIAHALARLKNQETWTRSQVKRLRRKLLQLMELRPPEPEIWHHR